MAVKLANNEQVIKEYNYATTTKGLINKSITTSSLIITNKRIIKNDVCETNGHEKISLSEIPVKAITGMNATMSSSFKYILLLLSILISFVGMIFLIGTIATVEQDEDAIFMLLPAIVCFILAFVFIYKFVTTRANVLVCNFFVADRINSAMFVGKASFNSLFSRFAVSGQSNVMRIAVNAAVARKFVNEIGALIADIQEDAHD